jgi:60 kDa SS-A/Ro ribonucleoprotein
MARLNRPLSRAPIATHEGGRAARINPLQQLRRIVMSNLLFEDTFYVDGISAAELVVQAANLVPLADLADIALQARSSYNLRHVPLLLTAVLCRRGVGHALVGDTIEKVIQRADELSEFLAIYAQTNNVALDKLKPKLSHQVRKGVARAFQKFDAYQLGKYNRDNAIKLRDVMFLCHPRPIDEAQNATWKKLAENTLESPDTWEVGLSTGGDKKEVFTRLLVERKLGYLALLRNLRNMDQAGVDEELIRLAILARKGGAERVLPFRYIAAARAVPKFEPMLDHALAAAVAELKPMPGKTALLVDVSGSMSGTLSSKSDLRRLDAAAALAAIWPGDKRIFVFATKCAPAPVRSGMGGIDAITNHALVGGGTMLAEAIQHVNKAMTDYDRLVVVTDEQSHDGVAAPLPRAQGYAINVGSYQNGVTYGRNWVHIDGFSEQVLRFLHEYEKDPMSSDIERTTNEDE